MSDTALFILLGVGLVLWAAMLIDLRRRARRR